VILAVERLAAHLLAGRTISVATLLVAGMLAAVPGALALGLAGELLGALDLLHLVAAPTALLRQLQALRAGTTMASFGAVVSSTSQDLGAGITTGRRGLGTGQTVVRLPAGAVPDQGQRARRALTCMAYMFT